jgi:hypothetical protein
VHKLQKINIPEGREVSFALFTTCQPSDLSG